MSQKELLSLYKELVIPDYEKLLKKYCKNCKETIYTVRFHPVHFLVREPVCKCKRKKPHQIPSILQWCECQDCKIFNGEIILCELEFEPA